MWFIVTVRLNCGDVVRIETKYLEQALLDIEEYYGDALAGYEATRR